MLIQKVTDLSRLSGVELRRIWSQWRSSYPYTTSKCCHEHLFEALIRFANFSPEDCLCDLGSGTGLVCNYFADKLSFVKGIEIDPKKVKSSRIFSNLNARNCIFEEGDIATSTLPSCNVFFYFNSLPSKSFAARDSLIYQLKQLSLQMNIRIISYGEFQLFYPGIKEGWLEPLGALHDARGYISCLKEGPGL